MPLTGKELLAAYKKLNAEGKSKMAQAKECGYTRIVGAGDKAGEEVVDVHGYSQALLEAAGISFATGRRGSAPRGRLLVSPKMTLSIGKSYLSRAGAQPGTLYEVQLEDDGVIALVPCGPETDEAA